MNTFTFTENKFDGVDRKHFKASVLFQTEYLQLFPRSILKYLHDQINRNFTIYDKLIKTCKYFFVHNNCVIPVWDLEVQNTEPIMVRYSENINGHMCFPSRPITCPTLYNKTSMFINIVYMTPSKSKFWIGNSIRGDRVIRTLNPWIKLSNQIYSSDIQHLYIKYQALTFSAYNLLTKNKKIKTLFLYDVSVKYDDEGKNGNDISLADFMENLPNAFDIKLIIPYIPVTSNTFSELSKIRRFVKLQHFAINTASNDCLQGNCGFFNQHITGLKQFIKENAAPNSEFRMYYQNLNEAENQRFQELNKMLEEMHYSWKPANERPLLLGYSVQRVTFNMFA